jgi:hypothetical protein
VEILTVTNPLTYYDHELISSVVSIIVQALTLLAMGIIIIWAYPAGKSEGKENKGFATLRPGRCTRGSCRQTMTSPDSTANRDVRASPEIMTNCR